MRNNLTDITVVLDRSGSMQQCKADAEVGLNAFIQQHAGLPGEAIFSLVQFDSNYEIVHRGVNLKNEVPTCTIALGGGTALLDAVGRAIIETRERLQLIPENDRPGLVVFVIITDGEENSSQLFTKARIKEMIERQQAVHGWQFTYIGANQDSFAEAGAIGIAGSSAVDFDTAQTLFAIETASTNVCRMRDMAASGTAVSSGYTDQERHALAGRMSWDRQTRIRLRGYKGAIDGKLWESGTLLRAGRLANLEIVLDDTSVSRRHAEVRRTDQGWRVRDLGSTNGTFINGTRLGPGEWPLHHHDILRCGNVTMVVERINYGDHHAGMNDTVEGG